MKEEDLHEVDIALCHFEDARQELSKAYIKQIKRLENQLKDAEEVIRFYADADQLTEEEKQMTAEKYHLVYGLKANDYLEKWGVK